MQKNMYDFVWNDATISLSFSVGMGFSLRHVACDERYHGFHAILLHSNINLFTSNATVAADKFSCRLLLIQLVVFMCAYTSFARARSLACTQNAKRNLEFITPFMAELIGIQWGGEIFLREPKARNRKRPKI